MCYNKEKDVWEVAMKLAIGGDVSVMCDCEELFDKCQTRELFNDVLDAFATADRCIVNL